MKETLICRHGNHTWERERKRGVKPRYCPDHRIVATPMRRAVSSFPAVPSTVVEPAETVPAQQSKRGAVVRNTPHFDFTDQDVMDVMSGPDSEARRQLRYMKDQSELPSDKQWRSSGDWRILKYSFDRLVHDIKVRNRPSYEA